MNTIEKAMERVNEPRGILVPSKLLEMSRTHDGVRYYVAECEEGKVSLIEAQSLIIEMLLNELRSIKK